jgi:hypothetical protein
MEHGINISICKAIIRSLRLSEDQDPGPNSRCVIPVLLEKCKIPIKLQHLTYSDMTIERDFVFEMKRLKHAMEHGINISICT